MLDFVFLYPLFMSTLWMAGGLYFYIRLERQWKWGEPSSAREVPGLPNRPLVTIIITCFNHEKHIEAALLAALQQRHDHIEVLAVNDGSTDASAKILDRMTALHPRLRVLHLSEHQGKAMALRMGSLAANSEYLVCIDGDAILDPDAVALLVRPMLDTPRVGAVSGNPRVRTRSTLVGRIQVGEFSSISSLIKRTQRIYGQVFTVSGTVAAFRRKALDRVGYWSLDMLAENIDISWKLQRDHWSIFYEPRALAWILAPETLHGLWKQRLHQAQGGAEALLKHIGSLFHWRSRRMWPLLAEFALSTLWAYAFALSILLYLLGLFVQLPHHLRVEALLPPALTGLVLTATCLLLFAVSMTIDRRYEKGLARTLFWVVWYPMAFWMISLFTSLVSFPRVMLRSQRQRARWVSPNRGIKQLDGTP